MRKQPIKVKTVDECRKEMGMQPFGHSMSKPLSHEEVKEMQEREYMNNKPTDAVKQFNLILEEMGMLHARKDADYGNSVYATLDEDGLSATKWRIGDKLRRLATLILKPAQVVEEKLRDTLIDIAIYAAKTVAWMDHKEEQAKIEQMHKATGMSRDAFDAIRYAYEKTTGADTDGDDLDFLRFANGPQCARELAAGVTGGADFNNNNYYKRPQCGCVCHFEIHPEHPVGHPKCTCGCDE